MQRVPASLTMLFLSGCLLAHAQSTPASPPATPPDAPTSQDQTKPTTKPSPDITAFPEDVSKAAAEKADPDAPKPVKKIAGADDPVTAFPEEQSIAAEKKARAEKNAAEGNPPDYDENSNAPVLKRKPKPAGTTDDPAASGESSSKQTRLNGIDDADNTGNSTDPNDTGVHEVRKFDPHRAGKDIEVGTFYFNQKNFKAAIFRFTDALTYKPGDVEATRMLGESYENMGRTDEARDLYEGYLKDFSKGPFAKEAQDKIDKLKQKP